MYVLFLNAVFWMLVQLKALESSSSGMKKASCPASCPTNEQKWKERAMEYNCTSGTSYHCILTQAGVCELCFAKFIVRKIGCPTIAWDNNTEQYHPELRNIDCPVNISGCPGRNLRYFSDELYRFPLCIRSNKSDDGEIWSSETTPSQVLRTTIQNISNTTSDLDNGNNIVIYILVGVFSGIFLLVAVLVIIWKRKSIREWLLQRRRRFKRKGNGNRSVTNGIEDDQLLGTQEGDPDEIEGQNIKFTAINQQITQALKDETLPTMDGRDKSESKSDDEHPSNGTYVEDSNHQVTINNSALNTTHPPKKRKDVSSNEMEIPRGMGNQSSTLLYERSQSDCFETGIWATFTEENCVLRCKVSHIDVNCTWYKKQTNGDMSKINDGDRFKVCQKKTFRILCLPKMSGSDGTYVCSLENGDEVEIDIDVEDSGAIGATVGEEIKFVRNLDETESPCSWYKNQTLLQNDELFIIMDSNEESTLTIKGVERGDPIPFGSKIGQEMQYYTLVSEDTENEQTVQTNLKSPDCDNPKENNETGCLANPVDETDSGYTKDEAQGSACDNVDSQPLVRKYDEQHQGLKNILGKVFRVSEWEKITELSRNIVTLFKGLPQTIFEEEDLQGLKSVVRQSTVECQKCVGGIFKYLLNILSNFENIPDQENTANTRVTVVELRVDLSNLIDFEAESKKEFDKSNASLEKNRKSFLRKIEEIEKDLQTKKVYPEEKNRLREGFTSIILHLGDICDILSNIMHSLSSLSNCLRNYRKVPQTSQEIRAMLHSLKTASLNLSDRISLESINDSLKEEFKDVLLQCNANTRQNEAVMEDSEENARQLLFGEEIDNRV